MPDVELGINDMWRQGKEVVGRHDIIPVVTEEWIRLENVEFHACVQQDEYGKSRIIKYVRQTVSRGLELSNDYSLTRYISSRGKFNRSPFRPSESLQSNRTKGLLGHTPPRDMRTFRGEQCRPADCRLTMTNPFEGSSHPMHAILNSCDSVSGRLKTGSFPFSFQP